MSIEWIARVGFLLIPFFFVGASARLLANRKRHKKVLESPSLAILEVTLFNASCYLAVGIPSDPDLLHRPQFLETGAAVWGFPGVGGIMALLGFSLLGLTVKRRRAIGAQDPPEGLITTGTYRFCRHPIYLGIVLISLAIALIGRNFDGMLVFPFVFLANFAQAKVEEKHDVGVRFEAQYRGYKRTTPAFGPVWLWVAVLVTIICFSIA